MKFRKVKLKAELVLMIPSDSYSSGHDSIAASILQRFGSDVQDWAEKEARSPHIALASGVTTTLIEQSA